jgi:ABC-type branched-subunit amino acid transport system ATPase component
MTDSDESASERTAEPPAAEPGAESPLVVADGLGLRTRRGWVFRDVRLALPADSVTALAGPAGSGRSMLLLTLAGRARPTDGTLTVAGDQRRPHIRQLVAVARITDAVEPEPELRVIDHVREAALLAGPDFDYPWARDLVGLAVDSATLAGDLPPDDATLFSVAVALAGRPRALVVDDVDAGASDDQQARIWRTLHAIAAAGVAVVGSTVEAHVAADAKATVVPTGKDSADARG